MWEWVCCKCVALSFVSHWAPQVEIKTLPSQKLQHKMESHTLAGWPAVWLKNIYISLTFIIHYKWTYYFCWMFPLYVLYIYMYVVRSRLSRHIVFYCAILRRLICRKMALSFCLLNVNLFRILFLLLEITYFRQWRHVRDCTYFVFGRFDGFKV